MKTRPVIQTALIRYRPIGYVLSRNTKEKNTINLAKERYQKLIGSMFLRGK